MTKSTMRVLGKIGVSQLASTAVALVWIPPPSAAEPDCELVAEETVFVDTSGRAVEAGGGDAIAYRRAGARVVVYERTAEDAAALVTPGTRWKKELAGR